MRRFLIAVGLMASASILAQTPAWKLLSSKEGHFSILMPAKPVAQAPQKREDKGLTFMTRMWTAQGAGKVSCVVATIDLPAKANPEVVNQIRLGIQSGVLQRVSGTKQSEAPATFAGIKGSSLKFEMDGGEGTVWTGRKGNRMYVMSIGMRGRRDAASEQRFFGSFKLLK